MRAMKTIGRALLLAAAGVASVAAAQAPVDDYAARAIGAPPAEWKLDPFYKRYVDAVGIPITSSAAVPDAALLRARDIVTEMLIERPLLSALTVYSKKRSNPV